VLKTLDSDVSSFRTRCWQIKTTSSCTINVKQRKVTSFNFAGYRLSPNYPPQNLRYLAFFIKTSVVVGRSYKVLAAGNSGPFNITYNPHLI